MNGQWIEIFKAGTHTAQDGSSRTYTEADLDKTCTLYNPNEHEAPLVVGHPKNNSPAYGWVKALRRNGQVLEMQTHQVSPEFTEAVKAGALKKRSISLYPDGSLRHVGFLGAVPPAVKGLKDIEFNNGESFLLYEDLTQPELDSGGLIFMEIGGNGMPETNTANDNADKGNSAEIAELKKLIEEQAEKLKQQEEQIAKLQAAVVEVADDATKKDAENFCEGLVRQGKLTPAQKAEAMALLTVKSGEVSFSESESVPVSEAIKKFLLSMPKQVDFAEFAVGGDTGGVRLPDFGGLNVDKSRAVLYTKAKEYQEKDKSLTFEQAVDIARKEDR